MNSDSNVLRNSKENNKNIPNEILNWYYDNNVDSIVIVWDQDNKIIYISEMVEDWFDFDVNSLIGEQWTSFITGVEVEKIFEHFEMNDERLEIPNMLLRTSSGREYSFHGIIEKINIESKESFICKLKNITYTNELKKVLLDSEKLVLAGQLAAGLVHEIRNPLTSLKGFIQLVQAGIQQQEKYYNVMIGEIEKLERITTELLQIAKPFQAIQQKEKVDELIHDVIFIMSSQTDLKDVYFITELEEDLSVICNATQIKQALINLIKNGAEAMDKAGVIKITLRKENKYVAIDVMDEGQGIPDDMVNELGTPFFTTKPDGTGLGLAITTHILEIHKGKLRISSDEDMGTNFTILLPIAKD